MIRAARKPKWLALLVGVLAAVALFGWLGKWQLDSAIASATPLVDPVIAAQPVALGSLMTPGQPMPGATASRTVQVSGLLTAEDLTVLPDRSHHGKSGWWVIGRLAVTDDGASACAADCDDPRLLPALPVALAWTADESGARTVAARLADDAATGSTVHATGTLEVGQEPVSARDHADSGAVLSMAPAQLANRWAVPGSAYYSAYVVVREGVDLPAGAEVIEPPDTSVGLQLNMLNVFYAIEWAIFAVMAVYIWWRLVRDDARADREAAAIAPDALAAQIRREKLRALAASRTGPPPVT